LGKFLSEGKWNINYAWSGKEKFIDAILKTMKIA